VPPKTRLSRYVALAERRAGVILVTAFLVAAGAATLASKLALHTDMAELLPDQHPAVVALRGIAGRQKSATSLALLIHGPSADANRAFAAALEPELDKLIPSAFSEIQWTASHEKADFGARWKWLYADIADLDRAENLLDHLILDKTNPLAVQIDGDPDAELAKLRAELDKKLPAAPAHDRFEGVVDGESYLGVMLWRKLGGVATAGDRETLETVKAIIARLDPHRFDAKLAVEFTGGIAQAIDEQNGIRDDLTLATVLCFGLVGLAVYSYFRRLALLLVIGAPVILGLLIALAIASLTIHYLNINTAFLISIILGNGINTPIVLLARYGEERRLGRAPSEAMVGALEKTWLGTLSATGAASLAYGCLALTSFRGFNQFGLVGGIGMLLVWLSTYLIVPSLVTLGEARWPASLTAPRNLWRGVVAALGRVVVKRPGWTTALVLASLLAALPPLIGYVRDPLEWNLDMLRSDATPSQRLWPKMEAIGLGDVGAGAIGNKGVLLVDLPEQADAVAAALMAADRARGPAHVLQETRTLSSVLPSDQDEKLETLARIRRKLDRHPDYLGPHATAWRPPDYLRRLTVDDLPPTIRDMFTETDGHVGRLVGIDVDRHTYYDWNGRDLLRLAKALEVDALGKHWVAASAVTVFAGMLESVVADGPRLTLIALLGVVVLLMLAFGIRGSVPVIGSLAIGLVWLGGLAGILHLKINFMNFVALPITLGVGADYAANMWSRLRGEPPGAPLADVIGDIGSAVALSSLTTIIGYATLLLSHNRALRSFGLLADLGELVCLVAALVALPGLVALARRKP